MHWRATLSVLLAWLSWSVLRVAHAEPSAAGSRVAVIGPPDAPVTRQLDAELGLLGFQVTHADAPETIAADPLRTLAADLDVAAAILVDSRENELDLWVVDRVTGKTTIRVIEVDDASSPDAARIAAVRAIDLLRASFRELETEPAPPEAEVAPAPPVRAAARPRAPRFALALGPAVGGSPGGVGATGHVAITFGYTPRRFVGLGVRGFAPIAGRRVASAEGAARLDIGWVTAGPRLRVLRPSGVAHLGFGLSAGPTFVGMRGEAADPYVGGRDLVVAGILELDAELAFSVHPRLRIWLDGSLGTVLPEVGVRFAGRRVATWGLPLGVGALGLQIVI